MLTRIFQSGCGVPAQVESNLAAHPEVVLSRRQLLEMVWDAQWTGDEHLVDVHIGRIRRKLGEDAGSPRFIHTVRGIGYRMGARR